jgi:uncharacterized repeat protein (TIGR02543 family)
MKKHRLYFVILALIVNTVFSGCDVLAELAHGPKPEPESPPVTYETTYTVTYNINEGSGEAPAAQTAISGSSITLHSGDGFSLSGYTFGGWNTDASGTGTNYSAGSSYTVPGAVTLHAKWIAEGTADYTVTYNINEGSGTAPAAQTAISGSSITLPSGDGLSRSGYTFGGWNTDASGTGTNYGAGSSYTVTGDVTLYAKWDVITYTVTFDINSGSGTTPSAQTVSLGSAITLPSGSGFSRTGYNFGGWNTDASGTGTNYDAGFPYTVTGNITLYAKWNATDYFKFVKEVTFTGNTANIVFENLNGNDIYLVKVNTSNSTVSAAGTGNANTAISVIQNTGNSSLSFRELPRIGHPAADAFRANHPPIVAEAPRRQRAVFAPPVVGNTRNFWVETYNGSRVFEQRQATLMAAGQHGNIWVMDENRGSGASVNKITTVEAQTLAGKFDLIYTLETNLLGYEYGGGPGGDGGKDGDPKIQMLVYDLVDESGGVTGGYFWGKDFFDDSQLGGVKSNLAEIFYIDASQVKSNPNYIYSILVHEFQHMICFNVKSVKHGVNLEAWYDEMLSTMAQDIIDPLIGIAATSGNHAIKVWMPTALGSYYLEGITEWDTIDSLNSTYANAFAFGAYLLRNYGGAELLQRILANDTAHVESITSALNEFSSGLTFEQALKRYGEAMIFSGSSMPENVMTFDKTVTKTINGTTYTAYGFDIWNDFTTKGPYVFDLSQREMMPHSITIHSTNEWKNLTGNFSITLNKPSNPNVVFYLMVK